MKFGMYEVMGSRSYRGHAPGTTFTAQLDRNAQIRAMNRGDIRLVEWIVPALKPGSFIFPEGWLLPSHAQSDHRGAERRLIH
jgi:hypothetical protein